MIVSLLSLLLLVQYSEAFFIIGSACGCPPMHPMCPPQPRCALNGVITQQTQPISVPDELELRAAAFGIPIGQQQQNPTSNLEQFEKLVDRQEESETAVTNKPPEQEENKQLLVALDSKTEVRRAPASKFDQSKESEVLTDASETNSNTDDEDFTTPIPQATTKCNSQVLRKLMYESMTSNSSESKRKVNAAAEMKFGGNVDVICSRGHFSYVFASNLFCEVTKDLVTCIAFRQASS
ncbi:ground-like domain protein [Dictyocaulus viviparus]|uniref:Ground-like domain protein n=1 Tax=Dictyocaulus viviparus TaxID=29172 RepID=A0A0D8Y6F5_DICVI|nr:ground-like domain protein [Dictyocaulus viviparus]